MSAGARPFDDLLHRMYTRAGLDDLPAHLSSTHGIDVTGVTTLDVGVLRIERLDAAPWVARVFPASRPPAATAGDEAVLRHLAACGYPAERLATDAPRSELHGQQVLVTEFVAAFNAKIPPDVYEQLGTLLARLHALPLPAGVGARPAGALHHFADGGRDAELAAASAWIDQIEERVPAGDRGRLDLLRAALADADDGAGLPVALIHPDPVPKNTMRTCDGYLYVDWAGAGIGPRVASLEYLLGSKAAAPKVMAGYARSASLTDEEWERLPAVAFGRRLVGLTFRLGFAPEKAAASVRRISALRREAQQLVAAARA